MYARKILTINKNNSKTKELLSMSKTTVIAIDNGWQQIKSKITALNQGLPEVKHPLVLGMVTSSNN